MEKLGQQENLPITKEQIENFLKLYERFLWEWKTVYLWEGEGKTTFNSYEKDQKKYIICRNHVLNVERVYDFEKNTISYVPTPWWVSAKEWELNQEQLKEDLEWIEDKFPPLTERIRRMIKDIIIRIKTS